MKKKILHVITGLELGGAQTALYRLLSIMPTAKYELWVIVLTAAGYYSPKIAALGITIHHLDIKKSNFFRKIWRLIFLIRKINPDLVQTWMYHADLLGGVSAKLCGIKKVVWGIRCEGAILKNSTYLIMRLCALLSWIVPQTIIVNSRQGRHNHVRVGYNANKVKIIYNGFDTNKFAPSLNKVLTPQIGEISLPGDAVILGTLARFHYDKDYPNFIKIIDPISQRYLNTYFVLCGPGCCASNVLLVSALKQLKYKNRVILLDGVDDAVGYLNKLDIFILASRTEGFPNSLAEAMACAIPCIATAVGESCEILGECGLIVPKEEPEKLLQACLFLLAKTSAERKQLGMLARKRIESLFSMDNNKTAILKIYEEQV